MNTNKIYKTLAFAYSAAEKAGATRFDPTCYEAKVAEILTSVYKFPIKRTLAKWNLTKLDNTLYTLECTNKPDGTATFKWAAIGTFDSDGLLYPCTNAPMTDDKPKKPTSAKGGGGKRGKGEINFNAFRGTRVEKNRALHAELVSKGIKDSRTNEYQAIWNARPWAK